VNVCETIDFIPSEVRNSGAQTLVLRLGGFINSRTDGIKASHLKVIRTVNQFAIVIEIPFHLGQTFDILLLGMHNHSLIITTS
jgi:hypothetical protein